MSSRRLRNAARESIVGLYLLRTTRPPLHSTRIDGQDAFAFQLDLPLAAKQLQEHRDALTGRHGARHENAQASQRASDDHDFRAGWGSAVTSTVSLSRTSDRRSAIIGSSTGAAASPK